MFWLQKETDVVPIISKTESLLTNPEALKNLETTDHVFLNKYSVLDLAKMRRLCQTNKSHRLSFDRNEDLTDEDYIAFTGLSKENVYILFETKHHLIKKILHPEAPKQHWLCSWAN